MDWQEQIDEIMDNFNFERVHTCMKAVNWTWWNGGEDDESGVPSVAKLRKRSREHLWSVANHRNKERIISSGGLEAQKYENGSLSLRFVLEEHEIYLD
jgi:hypothetical protein